MPRVLLALLLVLGAGSPFFAAPGMPEFLRAAVARVGSTWDPDGKPGADVGGTWDPDGRPSADVGSTWDPNG
ncbi:MAG TPA: hypothetical protein VN493_16240 [Thermoanaerobaculia bacterium]|nr:hypothetical protein [Thermoanaerobaculia bacterium]